MSGNVVMIIIVAPFLLVALAVTRAERASRKLTDAADVTRVHDGFEVTINGKRWHADASGYLWVWHDMETGQVVMSPTMYIGDRLSKLLEKERRARWLESRK